MAPTSRREFIKMCATGAAMSLLPRRAWAMSPPAKARQPNILYIFTDQQYAGTLSAAGCKDLHTPALDALAASGVRFESAYCTYPLCSPSRASMMTGKMPHEVGVMHNVLPLPPEGRQQEMGWLFRNAGYDTAYAGKWHLPKQLMDEGHGFEILCGMDDPLVTEKSIEFLAREHDKPFLLVASFIQPHGICSVTRFPDPRRKIEIAGLDPDPNDPDYIDKCPALPANFALPQPCPEAVLKHRNETREIAPENRPSFWAPEERLNAAAHWPDEYYRYYRRAYYRMVENVDQQIGQVLQALRDSGQEDNTLVVFSSDHGEMMGAHTLVMKRFFYEEAVRIPLLVSFKGRIAPGQVVDSALVSNGLDLLPTLCDYSGVTPPPGLEGASLRPLLEGAAPDDWRTELVIECDNPDSRMLHTGRYKYSHYATGANPEELYDLEQDPGELHNVVSDPEYAQVLADCRARLAAWRQAHGDIPVPSAPEAT